MVARMLDIQGEHCARSAGGTAIAKGAAASQSRVLAAEQPKGELL